MEMKLVVCLTGHSFSGAFLDCWTAFIEELNINGIYHWINRKQGSVIEHVRTACLDGDIRLGKNQKPFQGKTDYTHMLWIDSDQTFTFSNLMSLHSRNKDIISGVYPDASSTCLVAVKSIDYNYLRQHGTFNYMLPSDITGQTEPIAVAYTGMGFMLVKRGVFERVGYPWFRQEELKDREIIGSFSEDVSFCLNAAKAGFKTYLDPTVKIGHEKPFVLTAKD